MPEISELPAAAAPDGTETAPIVQGGETRQLAVGDFGGRLPPTVLFAADFGVEGDGVMGATGTTVASDNTFTDTAAAFTVADQGKTIMVNGAGAAGANFTTTIASINSATSIELTAAPATSIAGTATYVYGTDDTAAINTAIAAARTRAFALGKCTLQFDAAVYVIAAAPTVGTGGVNAQIPIPVGGVVQPCWVELAGAPGATLQHWVSIDNLGAPTGTVFFSTVAADTYAGAEGVASVFGGPASFKTGTVQARSYVNLAMRDIRIVQPDRAQLTAIDGGFFMSLRLMGVQIATLAASAVDENGFATTGTEPPVPANSQAFGVITPTVNNWNPGNLYEVSVVGHYCAFAFGELVEGTSIHTAWCNVTVMPLSSFHSTHIGQLIDVNNRYGIASVTPGTGVVDVLDSLTWDSAGAAPPLITAPILIDYWMIQQGEAAGSYARVADVHDSNNRLQGECRFSTIQAGVGIENEAFIRTVNGGSFFRAYDIFQKPGAVATPPAVPASGAARLNPFNRTAQVLLTSSGGTITSVTIAGVVFNVADEAVVGPLIVPAGRSITPTYTGTLTWSWMVL